MSIDKYYKPIITKRVIYMPTIDNAVLSIAVTYGKFTQDGDWYIDRLALQYASDIDKYEKAYNWTLKNHTIPE